MEVVETGSAWIHSAIDSARVAGGRGGVDFPADAADLAGKLLFNALLI